MLNKLLIFGIIITPFMNIGEVLSLMKNELISQAVIITPIYLKAIKDIIIFLIIFISSIYILKNKIKFLLLLNVIGFLNLIFFNIILSSVGLLEIFSGLRFLLPILVILLLLNINYKTNIILFIKYIDLLFYLNFIIQIIQFFMALKWFGLNFWGYTLRNPGFFLLPNTSAFFINITLFNHLFLIKKINIIKYIIYFISIILTMSGTGIMVFFIQSLLYIVSEKRIYLHFIMIFPIILSSLFFVNYFREEYINISGGTRFKILFNILKNTGFFSNNFGKYTNTYSLISGEMFIMDSFYAAILGNLGLLGGFALFLPLVLLFIYSYLKAKKEIISLFYILLIFGSTTIITEVYPINLILPFLFSYLFNLEPRKDSHSPQLRK